MKNKLSLAFIESPLIFAPMVSGQDGRVVYGAAFRSQSTYVGVGSNPTSDILL